MARSACQFTTMGAKAALALTGLLVALAPAPASAGIFDGLFGPSKANTVAEPKAAPLPGPAAAAPAAAAPAARPAAVPLPWPRPRRLAVAAPAAAPAAPAPAVSPAAPASAAAPTSASAVAAGPLPLQASAAPPKALPRPVARDGFSAEQVGAIERVDNWFNSFDHLVGTFTQIAPDGARSRGRFYLAKPGKLRFQYALPSTLDVISNGRTVAVVDHKLNTSDVYPLTQTPLRFLLKPDLDLLKDAKVTAVATSPQRTSVTVEERSTVIGTSRLTVVFAGNPFALKQWTVTDPQGLDTTVMVDHLDSHEIPPAQAFTIN